MKKLALLFVFITSTTSFIEAQETMLKNSNSPQLGITYSKNILSDVKCLKAECLKTKGLDFIVRYYCNSATAGCKNKLLSYKESEALLNAGLSIVVVHQNIDQSKNDFSFEQGKEDANDALNYAKNIIKQQKQTAIYFVVDYDAIQEDIDKYVKPYFKGINEVFKDSGYLVGVYGSGLTCRNIKEEEALASFSMLSLAYLWAESETYKNWDIFQGFGKGDLCGISKDDREDCHTKSNNTSFGQFSRNR